MYCVGLCEAQESRLSHKSARAQFVWAHAIRLLHARGHRRKTVVVKGYRFLVTPCYFSRKKLLALAISFSSPGLVLVGSSLGGWRIETIGVEKLWPYIRWAVELLYFIATNVKQRLVSTLPGAVIAVGGWIGRSYLPGVYCQDFSAYSKGYCSLGVALALGIWRYWTGFAILIGAPIQCRIPAASESGTGA